MRRVNEGVRANLVLSLKILQNAFGHSTKGKGMYLIHGVFFQNQEWLSTTHRSPNDQGPLIESGITYEQYAGAIYRPADPNQLVGVMTDRWGASEITNFVMTESVLCFTKKYVNRSDLIAYAFKLRDEMTWVGEYDGPEVGSGISQCVVTKVADDFFSPRRCMILLGRTDAHSWKPRYGFGRR